MEEEREIKTWCSYCKDPIYEGEPYVIDGDNEYHVDCHKQMNTYSDAFGFDVEDDLCQE